MKGFYREKKKGKEKEIWKYEQCGDTLYVITILFFFIRSIQHVIQIYNPPFSTFTARSFPKWNVKQWI